MSVANQYEMQMLALINAERAKAGLQPLKINSKLNTSAETHSSWMLNADVFSHTGANGSTATDRMRAAGYVFSGNWSSGENIAWQSERGAAGISDDVINLHQSLMNSPGHRANILNPNFTEVGIGIEEGGFRSGGTDWPAVMVTQNFARSSADNGGGGVVTPPPTFTITEGADVITGSALADVIDARGGADRVSGNDGADSLGGGVGNDSLFGGNSNDRLDGGDGADILDGGAQDDLLLGGDGTDRLFGADGNDVLMGGNGRDWLEGGAGNDLLTGSTGGDQFIFRPGCGADRVTDFADNIDTLVFAGQPRGTSMTARAFVDSHATIVGGAAVFDLGGGNILTVNGIDMLSKLYDDVSLIG